MPVIGAEPVVSVGKDKDWWKPWARYVGAAGTVQIFVEVVCNWVASAVTEQLMEDDGLFRSMWDVRAMYTCSIGPFATAALLGCLCHFLQTVPDDVLKGAQLGLVIWATTAAHGIFMDYTTYDISFALALYFAVVSMYCHMVCGVSLAIVIGNAPWREHVPPGPWTAMLRGIGPASHLLTAPGDGGGGSPAKYMELEEARRTQVKHADSLEEEPGSAARRADSEEAEARSPSERRAEPAGGESPSSLRAEAGGEAKRGEPEAGDEAKRAGPEEKKSQKKKAPAQPQEDKENSPRKKSPNSPGDSQVVYPG